MQQGQGAQLSLEDRRLLNVLEIKIYDLSENMEILAKQLTTNQIKDAVSQTYSIFYQLRRIFEKMEAMFLYEILRKMQINIVMVCSVLTDRLDQGDQKTYTARSNSRPETPSTLTPIIQQQTASLNINLLEKVPVTIPKLGGINLYNECYKRGIEYYQVTDINNLQELAGKCRMKQSKKFREELLESVARELENTTDVETETINDEIKNYIRDYKENSRIGSCVSYEKELSEIIDFFKMCEMDAMNFLNKSPKNSKEHTEDFINRLEDMEKDIKIKQSNEKNNIHEKMKFFIAKLKEKMLKIQKNYEHRNAKLIEFQKSLKKETVAFGTQTYDGYERKLKQLQNNIIQTEEKYLILTQMRKKEFNFEDQIYDLNHQLHVKSNENAKLMQINLQQEDELEHLKKIIRQSKEKMSLPVQIERKKPKNKAKLLKEFMARSNEQNKVYLDKGDETSHDTLPHGRESRAERKTKRFEKLGTPRGLGMCRPSIDIEQIQRLEKVCEYTKDTTDLRLDHMKKSSIFSTMSNKDTQVLEDNREKKDSVFKNEHRKALKKQSEQEKQVSFNFTEQSIMPSRHGSTAKIQDLKFKDRMTENTRSIQLIDGSRLDRDELEEQSYSRRALRKNTLKQKIELSIASNRSLQNYQQKKSSKSIGKCFIKKENKQKNTISTSLFKLSNLTIREQFSINIQLQSALSMYKQKSLGRQHRSSFQLAMNRNNAQNSEKNIQAVAKVGNFYKELKNKVRGNNQSIHNLPNRSLGHQKIEQDVGCRNSIKAIDDRIRNMSKKENNLQNQGRKQPSISTFLTKKSKKQLVKHSSKLQGKFTVNKRIASCLKISLLKKTMLFPEEWSQYIKTMPAEQVALTNLIKEKIKQQNLNMKQFQQIISIMEECEESMKEKPHFSLHEKKKSQIYQQPDRYLDNKNSGNWPLSIVCLMRIREVHAKIGECGDKENNVCEHIEKYLSILRKINDYTFHSKLAYKLPIEKIGEQSFLKSTEARFSLNHCLPAKKNQHHNDSFTDQFNLNKSIQHMNSQFQSTLDEKQRILPIIGGKNKGYKGKVKLGK